MLCLTAKAVNINLLFVAETSQAILLCIHSKTEEVVFCACNGIPQCFLYKIIYFVVKIQCTYKFSYDEKVRLKFGIKGECTKSLYGIVGSISWNITSDKIS